MRAVLIETDKQTIREVEFDGTLEGAYSLLDVRIIQGVYLEDHVIYVDEEGLLNDTQLKGFFRWKSFYQPLAGRGLILGGTVYGDDWGPATMTIEEATDNVVWLP